MDISDKTKHSFGSLLIAGSFMRYKRNRFSLNRWGVLSTTVWAQQKSVWDSEGGITLFELFQSIGLLRVTALNSAWVAWFYWLGLPRAIRCPPTLLGRNYEGREVVFKSRGQWILLSCEDIWTWVKWMVATSKVDLWCNLLKIENTRKYMEEISSRVLKKRGRRRKFDLKREEITRDWKKKLRDKAFHNLSFLIIWLRFFEFRTMQWKRLVHMNI
jgi:hypothetical protein